MEQDKKIIKIEEKNFPKEVKKEIKKLPRKRRKKAKELYKMFLEGKVINIKEEIEKNKFS